MATARKKKATAKKASSSVETVDEIVVEETEVISEELVVEKKSRKERKASGEKIPGAMAPFAIVLSLAMIVGVLFSFFYQAGSTTLVTPEVSTDLKVRISLTSIEFASEGASAGDLGICQGTPNLPNLGQARVIITDLQNQKVAELPLKSASSRVGTTCSYAVVATDYKKFSGSTLKVLVRFTFGDSNIFTVDVGDKPPYNFIDINLTLG